MAFLSEFLLLLEPLALAFVIYASFRIMSPALFASAYVTICLYLVWNLWPDEHTSFGQKCRLSAYIPFLYFAFYTMNVVQFSAMVRCLAHPKQILRKDGSAGSHWISPERADNPQVTFV